MTAAAALDFLILGPLEVRAAGEPLALGGPKQRALLALLLLNANEVVSRARLLDELWGEQPAGDARHALDVQISRLRKVLGDVDVLQTRAPGYILRVEPGRLDLERFERLRADAREALNAGDALRAADALSEALSLWRGSPLTDLEFEPSARVEIERLQELRLTAIEERIAVDLTLGRHAELVAELETLVAAHPLRERLREHLMLGLYRCGRQVEALEHYRSTRALLVDELGIEPGARLRELEASILAQHTALDAYPAAALPTAGPTASPAPQLSADTSESHTGNRRRAWAVLFAALATAALTLVALLASGDDGPRPLATAGLALVSLDGHAVQAVVALSSPPTSVTAGFGSLWVSHADDGTVTRVDLAKRTVRDTIKVGGGPNAIAAAGGSIWVANALDGTLSRIDPASDEVTQALAVGRLPTALAAGHGALWVANGSDGTVSRVDPVRGRVAATIRVGRAPSGIATASRTVWVTNESSGTVSRIDPATSAVSQTINVGDAPSSVAAAGRSVWILDRLDSTVSRLDEQSEAVTATIAIRGAPGDLAVSRGAAWVTNDSAGTVSRIDDQRATVTRVVRVGDGAAGLLATPEGIWAAVTPGGATHRGGTLTAVAASELDTLDPALTFFSHQLVGMTNDGLVAFNHVSGARGAQLVPDLALTLPTPTDHGRTYTFRLRPAIRYSTGAVVTARDVRRSLERVYELGSPATPFYDSITGAHACAAPAHHCDLSRGITTDDDAGTVTFHLRTPDPDFLYKLALPYADVLPASTPSRPAAGTLVAAGVTPVRLPATGPYVVAGYAPSRALRLVRNPHYREWSRAAQPAGYPDRITVRLGLDPAQGAALMLRGHGDFMANIGPAPARQRETLRTRHASQLRVNPLPQTNFLFFNTRVAPFDDVRVRRALNYALDRRRLVDRYGGRSTAQLTCQILPPQIPGYRRYCPYSRNPRADGIWRGPDLATARRLVAESGTRGARVVVWTTPTPQVAYDEARDVVTALRRLRYRASLRALPDHRFFRYTNDSDNRAQIVSGGWGLDYPAASDILVRLTCPYFKPGNPASQDPGGLCDPALDRKIKHATALQATQPDKAASLWSGIDRELVDRAIWLPTVTPRETDIVSRRVGNYRYHLMFGAMVDQMWVR